MITYLDLLPYDILSIIEKKVNELYLEEHRKKMHDINIEFSSFWLIAKEPDCVKISPKLLDFIKKKVTLNLKIPYAFITLPSREANRLHLSILLISLT